MTDSLKSIHKSRGGRRRGTETSGQYKKMEWGNSKDKRTRRERDGENENEEIRTRTRAKTRRKGQEEGHGDSQPQPHQPLIGCFMLHSLDSVL